MHPTTQSAIEDLAAAICAAADQHGCVNTFYLTELESYGAPAARVSLSLLRHQADYLWDLIGRDRFARPELRDNRIWLTDPAHARVPT